MKCAVCLSEGAEEVNTDFANTDVTVTCRRCGSYRTTEEAQEALCDSNITDVQRASLSGFLSENVNFRFHSKSLPALLSRRVPGIAEKADRLLSWLAATNPTPGRHFALQCDDPRTLNFARAWDLLELQYLAVDYMTDLVGYLDLTNGRHLSNNGLGVKIAPRGWQRIADLREVPTDSYLGFIAIWFDTSMESVRDSALIPAVLGAGYEPRVMNLHEHVNRIDDEIVALIRRSKFVVADFTGSRGGVYFEAGFAHGLGCPVIWTCNQSTYDSGDLHFDVSHFNFIFWSDGPEGCEALRTALQHRIEHIVGRGPSAPVTPG